MTIAKTLPRIAAVFALSCLVTQSQASAKADAAQRTAGIIDAFIAVKPVPEDGSALSAADKAANKKAFAELDGYFDFDSMTEAAIGVHKSKFSPEQLKTYKDVFTQLIRLVAYPDSGIFLKSAERKIKKAKTSGATAQVPVFVAVEEEDLEMDVAFHWRDSGEWKLVDVAFDGARLTKDYQNQFGRIIKKDGVDGLVKKLQKRLDKEKKAAVL